MTLHKMPLFVWAMLMQSVIIVLCIPVLAGLPFVPALNLAVCGDPSMLWTVIMPVRLIRDNPQVMCRNFMSGQNLNDCAPRLLNRLSSYTRTTFAPYLAGLIEGDGTIVVPKTKRSLKGKLNYPSVQIAFAAKDYPFITILRLFLGCGSISKRKMQAAYIYTINDREGITALVNFINGFLRTPKIHDFDNLAHYLNIVPKGIDTSNLSSNAWLAGFIERDGSFQVRTSLTSRYPQLALSFELTQAQTNHDARSSLSFMSLIGDFLGVSVNAIREDRKYPQYRIRTSTITTNVALKQYFSNYPLLGTKYLDSKDWFKILDFFVAGTQWYNLEEIKHLKHSMNNGRTLFNWDHLL